MFYSVLLIYSKDWYNILSNTISKFSYHCVNSVLQSHGLVRNTKYRTSRRKQNIFTNILLNRFHSISWYVQPRSTALRGWIAAVRQGQSGNNKESRGTTRKGYNNRINKFCLVTDPTKIYKVKFEQQRRALTREHPKLIEEKARGLTTSWERADANTSPRSAAVSILTSCPVGTSRVLDCLSHMTRVFVPVISSSISVYQCRWISHFKLQPSWICLNRVWTALLGKNVSSARGWQWLPRPSPKVTIFSLQCNAILAVKAMIK